tara:strand:- start:465 stop:662 length:198 start_codon:yes stop_codon:yes gene_type:complete
MDLDKLSYGMSNIYTHFAEEYRDTIVDVIEELHFALCRVMPLQDADLCWNYLVMHYYYDKPFGET